MKLLIPIFFIAVCFQGAAQDKGTQKPKIPGYMSKTKPFQYQDLLLRNDTINYPQLSRGKMKPGVYALRQDNMPCKVPDTNGLVQIPNGAPVTLPFKSNMPNPSPYYRGDSSLFQQKVVPGDK